jgi:hypothetical protein
MRWNTGWESLRQNFSQQSHLEQQNALGLMTECKFLTERKNCYKEMKEKNILQSITSTEVLEYCCNH